MKTCTVFLSAALLICVSCVSPEADGRQAASFFRDCEQELTAALHRATADFITDFDGFGFRTRVDAREKSLELIKEVQRDYEEGIRKAQRKYVALQQKYVGKEEKLAEFETAFALQKAEDAAKINHDIPNQDGIDGVILTVIPPRPEEEKIKADLIGRKLVEPGDGYFSRTWYWEIVQGEIREFELLDVQRKGEDWQYRVRLVVQAEGKAIGATVRLIYTLGKADDWRIDLVETEELHIVKTGKYDHCIKVTKGGGFWDTFNFRNDSDASLLVGGAILYHGVWEKFCILLEGNGEHSLSGIEYRIDFVERP